MRVVLDSNVLLSALISPHGIPDIIYRAWQAGKFDIITSTLQLDELRRASRYPKFKAITFIHSEGCTMFGYMNPLFERANNGDSNAQYDVGWRYENAIGMSVIEYQLSFQWYQTAAAQEHTGAQLSIAYCYWTGCGVAQDEKEAGRLFQQIGRTGIQDPSAKLDAYQYYAIAACYEMGFGVEKDEEKMVAYYRKSAELGFARGQIALADCFYKRGREEQALAWCSKAISQGYVPAKYMLALNYLSGIGMEKNETKGIEGFHVLAFQGYAPAQKTLGCCYFTGRGVKQDKNNAFKWMHKAALQGMSEAQNILGFYYLNGDGVKKDDKKAFEQFYKAAVQGEAEAECALGVCYYLGRGIEKDGKKAFEWISKAASHGITLAQLFMAHFYQGTMPVEGLKQNMNTALFWMVRAATQGDGTALTVIRLYCEQYKTSKDPLIIQQRSELLNFLAKKGDCSVQYTLGNDIADDRNDSALSQDSQLLAQKWLICAGRQGSSEAKTALSKMKNSNSSYLAKKRKLSEEEEAKQSMQEEPGQDNRGSSPSPGS